MISARFQCKPFNITVIQVYTPNHWCHRSWSWLVLWRPTRPSRTNTKKKKKKKSPFHHRGMECKSRKSRDTQNNTQLWLWSTKANRVLAREHAGHSKHSFPTIQEMTLHMNITRWSIPISDYVLCSWRWRSSIQSAKLRPGADCGSDQKRLITKFRLKLKKIRKTTRPSRYDLNQIPYDYTVEVTYRFKGLDLIYRVLEELWMRFATLYRR